MNKFALIAALTATTGCATVIRGADDKVAFESVPSGATVTAERITESDDNPISCVTPCKLELGRKRDYNVTFALNGYKPAKAKLSSVVSGDGAAGFLGNALIGGPIGAVVDAGTGAAQDLAPNPMKATLALIDSAEDSKVVDKNGKPAPGPEYRDASGKKIEAPASAAPTADPVADDAMKSDAMKEGATMSDPAALVPEAPTEAPAETPTSDQ